MQYCDTVTSQKKRLTNIVHTQIHRFNNYFFIFTFHLFLVAGVSLLSQRFTDKIRIVTLDSLIFVDAAEVSGVHEEAQEDPVFPLGSIGLQLSPIDIY